MEFFIIYISKIQLLTCKSKKLILSLYKYSYLYCFFKLTSLQIKITNNFSQDIIIKRNQKNK